MPLRSAAAARQRRSAQLDQSSRSSRSAGQLALAGAAEHEQLVDDVREPVDLGDAGVELGGGGRR